MTTRSLSMPHTATRAARPSLVARLTARLSAGIGGWARRRRNRAVLAELSDQQLADIGLERNEVGYRPLDDGPVGWDDLGRRL